MWLFLALVNSSRTGLWQVWEEQWTSSPTLLKTPYWILWNHSVLSSPTENNSCHSEARRVWFREALKTLNQDSPLGWLTEAAAAVGTHLGTWPSSRGLGATSTAPSPGRARPVSALTRALAMPLTTALAITRLRAHWVVPSHRRWMQ